MFCLFKITLWLSNHFYINESLIISFSFEILLLLKKIFLFCKFFCYDYHCSCVCDFDDFLLISLLFIFFINDSFGTNYSLIILLFILLLFYYSSINLLLTIYYFIFYLCCINIISLFIYIIFYLFIYLLLTIY